MTKLDKKMIIIKAAMKLLATQGFHGAPMAQISEQAGVGAGTIYRYFKNRDVLIVEIHQYIIDEFLTYLNNGYPSDRPVRECFFYIGKGIIEYYIRNPLQFLYNEQFFYSPYGLQARRNRLVDPEEQRDIFHDFYRKGIKDREIKQVPLPVFFDLAIAPIFWVVRDHLQGLVNIDDALAEVVVSSCWDCIRRS